MSYVPSEDSVQSLPKSYKALTFSAASQPLSISELDLSPPDPGELIVKVKCAAINPVDIQLWNSWLMFYLPGTKNRGIGRDYSGVVVKAGSDVKQFKAGDEVFGLYPRMTAEGTFAEYIKVDPKKDPTAKRPTCWDWAHAAAVPLVVLTAYSMLDNLPKEDVRQGQRRVVVNGASGGVGIWCVQLAKVLYNCHVTAICSSRNAEFVTSLGADEVIDYTSEFVPQALLEKRPATSISDSQKKYDLICDCVGGTELIAHMHELLHPKAAYITIVGDKTDRNYMGGPMTYFIDGWRSVQQITRHIKGMIFGPRYANVYLFEKADLLQKTAGLAERGDVKVFVQEVIEGALEDEEKWKEVFKHMQEGRVRGKIVVKIS